MQRMNIGNYSELINSHMAKVRGMLKRLNPAKRAIYWSNKDTFYQRYQAGDIVMYWDGDASIDAFFA